MSPNEPERQRWNDEEWIAGWLHREQVTDAVTGRLLEHVRPSPGDRLLDVGSGGGRASLALARRVAPGGSVVGVDISVALVELAGRRAEEAGVDNAHFSVGDAQEELVAGGPFTSVVSQFGVMFFDEPVRAFTNLRRHVRSGGRLVFLCWQELERNPWFPGHALGGLVPPAPPPPPGKAPTGPFVLGDARATTALLEEAGWTGVVRTPYEQEVEVDEEALADDERLRSLGLRGEDLQRARSALEEHLAGFRVGADRCRIHLAFQVFEATSRR